jgi:hypothetical protein
MLKRKTKNLSLLTSRKQKMNEVIKRLLLTFGSLAVAGFSSYKMTQDGEQDQPPNVLLTVLMIVALGFAFFNFWKLLRPSKAQ